MDKAAFVATVYAHLNAFHIPYMSMLRDQGVEVHAYASPDAFRERLVSSGFICHDVPFRRSPFRFHNLLALRMLTKSFRRQRYRFVHVNTPVGGAVGRLAARMTGTPVVYTAHGFHFFKGGPLRNWLFYYPVEKALARLTDVLVTVNEEDHWRAKRMVKPGTRVYRLPGMGVDQARFDRGLQGDEDSSSSPYVILTVGELNRNKNQIQVIRALPLLARQFPDIRYVLAGEGGWEKRLRAEAARLGVADRVTFAGYRPDTERLLQACDVFVLPSRREGLGVAAVEAMMAGLPIIMTPTAGGRTLVDVGSNGWMVPFGDHRAMADAISAVLGNRKLAARMGVESKRRALAFSREPVAKLLEEIYASLLGSGVTPAERAEALAQEEGGAACIP